MSAPPRRLAPGRRVRALSAIDSGPPMTHVFWTFMLVNASALAAGTPSRATKSTGMRRAAAKARPAADSLLAALTATAPPNAGTDRVFSSAVRTSIAPATALPMSAGVAPVRRMTLALSAVGVANVVVVVGAPAAVVGGAVVLAGTVEEGTGASS